MKAAIVKKEEVVQQLKEQYQAALKRADHLEGLLDQQRKQLLGKKWIVCFNNTKELGCYSDATVHSLLWNHPFYEVKVVTEERWSLIGGMPVVGPHASLTLRLWGRLVAIHVAVVADHIAISPVIAGWLSMLLTHFVKLDKSPGIYWSQNIFSPKYRSQLNKGPQPLVAGLCAYKFAFYFYSISLPVSQLQPL